MINHNKAYKPDKSSLIMSGLLIFRTYFQSYSFVIADDTIYSGMKEELAAQEGTEILFEQGGVTLGQIYNVRENVSGIVKKLNNGEEVNISKELSSYFLKQHSSSSLKLC